MKLQKSSRRVRLLISIGLLLTTMPLLFKAYVPIPDFVRGVLAGVGLGMEVTGLVLMKRRQSSCHSERNEESSAID